MSSAGPAPPTAVPSETVFHLRQAFKLPEGTAAGDVELKLAVANGQDDAERLPDHL